MALEEGDSAPDFSCVAHTGKTLVLSELLRTGPVVVYFYPRDGTPVCTNQACGIRDVWSELKESGVAVIGVSEDSDARHRKFAEKHKIPFPLISDRSGDLRTLFGVGKTLGLIPKRVTFVIDQTGTIAAIEGALMSAEPHLDRVLKTVRRLTGES